MNTVNDQRTSHNLDFSQNGGTLKNLFFFFNLLTGFKKQNYCQNRISSIYQYQ